MGRWRTLLLLGAVCTLLSCGGSSGNNGAVEEDEERDSPEIALGERLFLETRFAQAFFAAAGPQVNAPGPGDPVMDVTVTTGAPLPGPFRGAAMNCRACHLVDEQRNIPGGGVRTYADFARRSPVPQRDDGLLFTPRNSPALVNASLRRDGGFFLHFDGEFPSMEDLVRGTFTGRNFGWLPTEERKAVAHIADVVRGDDGTGRLARDFGGLPYRIVFAGGDPGIPSKLRLPPWFRLDVEQASDAEILDAVANVVSAYVESLVFAQDGDGHFFASPYDAFLRKNGLPRAPDPGESVADYNRRLRNRVDALQAPRFVTPANGAFQLHAQEFAFGERELAGLKTFLTVPDDVPPAAVPQGAGVGNCVSCHPAPDFTDFRFHNTGAAQDEYDAIHGAGAFMALAIPGLEERNAAPENFLPPSPEYPLAIGRFRAVPSLAEPGQTDLGVWNVLANPAMPGPQAALEQLLCSMQAIAPADCSAASLLPTSIALFKTPGLRDLGQSPPYLHTGQKDTLEDVIEFYITASALARAGELRNAAPELGGMALTDDDVAPLAAFLRSLNEDYE
jgi:cytochrome c peroxidase